ncbi:methyltransferase-like protein 13 isoform X3 [Populus alba x Populus x berolinensis]|nr:methyltransferase-like protein 13 isoform X3 [Populus alba x Populus x berolinensis]
MYRDVSSCNTYNYGDALYWDARYVQEAESFDWYQHYSSLRPFVRRYIPTSSRVLMVGCGNALMSENMVEDGYENITNIDISSVAIDIMRRKYEHVHQLNCILLKELLYLPSYLYFCVSFLYDLCMIDMEMDARDMSFFPDKSFDAVVDKGIYLSLPLDLLFNVDGFFINLVVCMLTLFLLFKFILLYSWPTNPQSRDSRFVDVRQ